MHFLDWLGAMGGVCTTSAATEHTTRAELRRLRDSGALWTPLRGWVALSGLESDATRALRLGGVVSCVSAFRAHGVWVPHGDDDLHVRVNRETHSERVDRAEGRDGVLVHRMHAHLLDLRPWDAVDGVVAALAVATGCLSTPDLIAAADSALQQGKVQRSDLDEMAAALPARRRAGLERASHLSGSGSESTFAALLRRCGIAFEQQAQLLPGEFCDFLIGRSLVVEIDSVEWHGSRAQQAVDRRRDAQLTALGYRVLRFSYEQVLFEPAYVVDAVLALVRRDVHERRPWAARPVAEE